jgi:hypothetical protein
MHLNANCSHEAYNNPAETESKAETHCHFSPYNLKTGKEIDVLEARSGIWAPPFSGHRLTSSSM